MLVLYDSSLLIDPEQCQVDSIPFDESIESEKCNILIV